MIFVTVGTHDQAFTRLLEGVEELPNRAEAIVQYGRGAAPAGVERAVDFMPFDQMERCFEDAELVITHAGVGSILCARRAGHVPIVIPRYHQLGEHVDDHQVELTRALAGLGEVVPVWRDERLAAVVAGADHRSGSRKGREGNHGALQRAVRASLLEAQ